MIQGNNKLAMTNWAKIFWLIFIVVSTLFACTSKDTSVSPPTSLETAASSTSHPRISTPSPTPLPPTSTATLAVTEIPSTPIKSNDPITAGKIDQLILLGEWGDSVSQVVISPNNDFLGVLNSNHRIDILELATLEEVKSIIIPKTITTFTFSPDAKVIAAGLDNQEIQFWDIETARLIGRTLSIHTDTITTMLFTPTGKILASGSMDGTVNLWDVNTGELHRTLGSNGGEVTALAVSPDGELLAYADYLYGGVGLPRNWSSYSGTSRRPTQNDNDINIRIWKLQDEEYVKWQVHDEKNKDNDEEDEGDDKENETYKNYLTLGKIPKFISFDEVYEQRIGTATINETKIETLEFSPDGKNLITGFRIWDIAAGKSIKSSSNAYEEYVYSLDSELLLVKDSPIDGLVIQKEATDEELLQFYRGTYVNWEISPSREKLVVVNDKGLLEVWQFDDNNLQASKQFDQITTFTYSQDGKQIALAISDQIYIKILKNGQTLQQLGKQGENITSLAYSPDGSLLASGSEMGNIHLWAMEDEETVRILSINNEEKAEISEIKFSLDGNYFTVVYGNKMGIWATSDKAPMQTVDYSSKGYEFLSENEFLSLQVISLGKTLASSSTYSIWDIPNNKSVDLITMDANICDFKLSPDKTKMLYIADGGAFRIISSLDGSKIKQMTAPQNLWLKCTYGVSSGYTTDLELEWADSLIIVIVHPGLEYRDTNNYMLHFFELESGEYLRSVELEGAEISTLSPDNSLITILNDGRLLFYGLPENND